MSGIPVYLELGAKKLVFASAVDWPGWARSGKDEALALEALGAAAPRYAAVTALAGEALPELDSGFTVVERVAGSASTDFGVLVSVPEVDRQPVTPHQAARLASLLSACWRFFDTVVAGAPATLRKGPRGGGRDRDAVAAHVVNAEAEAYARKLGLRLATPDPSDRVALGEFRQAVLARLVTTEAGAEPAWPVPYAARRMAWHVLDHAWEIEDKSQPAPLG